MLIDDNLEFLEYERSIIGAYFFHHISSVRNIVEKQFSIFADEKRLASVIDAAGVTHCTVDSRSVFQRFFLDETKAWMVFIAAGFQSKVPLGFGGLILSAGGSFLVKDICIFKGFCQVQLAAVAVVHKDFFRVDQRIFSLGLAQISARAVFFGVFSFCDLPADIIGDLAPAFRI